MVVTSAAVARRQRLGSAFVVSCVYHLAAIALVLIALRSTPRATRDPPGATTPVRTGLTYVIAARAADSGGGDGGGNQMKSPPRRVELPGRDTLTVPVARAVSFEPAAPSANEPDPVERLVIPAERQASGVESLPGAMTQLPSDPMSRGPGRGTTAGPGVHDGDGSSDGSGVGDGWKRGIGGGPGGLGGVVAPRVVRIVKPQYTTAAMTARIQGVVVVACVVQADGSVADPRVVRSLDRVFGLDQEAINAAGQWHFLPGTQLGKPVPVQVTIEVGFTLR